MNYDNRIKFLEESHRVLDHKIDEIERQRAENRSEISTEQIGTLKKQRLHIRDELNRLRKSQFEDSQRVHFEEDR